jgi:RHS repeat-associated protein
MDVGGTQTWTVYDGLNTYADFSGAGTLQERYLNGAAVDALLARTDSGGTSAWYLADRLGSVRDVVSSSGVSTFHTGYDGFGNAVSQTGTGGDRFMFTGREFDATPSAYFFRARYYDAGAGRFLSRDPIGAADSDPDLFRYARNDPINWTDRLGLESSGQQQSQSASQQQAEVVAQLQAQADAAKAEVEKLKKDLKDYEDLFPGDKETIKAFEAQLELAREKAKLAMQKIAFKAEVDLALESKKVAEGMKTEAGTSCQLIDTYLMKEKLIKQQKLYLDTYEKQMKFINDVMKWNIKPGWYDPSKKLPLWEWFFWL